jgi:hypothetical protein
MNILITGGTGLVGTRLTELLIEQGHSVWHLSRKAQQRGNVKTFVWDIDKGFIDEEALLGADYIIHLAGAGIADERWTPERKKEIIDSRTKSIGLIPKNSKLFHTKFKGLYRHRVLDFMVQILEVRSLQKSLKQAMTSFLSVVFLGKSR